MKHLKVALLALLLVTAFSNVNAQDENNPWAVSFGANAIDFYSTNSIPGTTWYDQFFNANDHYNMIPAVSRLTVGRYVTKGLSVGLDGSFNQISKVGDMEVDDLAFWGIDGVAKWSVGSVVELGDWWEPYLLVGFGYTWMDDATTWAVNGGAGMNFWFNDKVGINIESKVRETMDDAQVYSHFQHSVGVIFKMGGTDTDGDGVYDKQDACPEEFGLEEFNGCPDTDGDGIIDSEDECPDEAGLAEFNGCPDADGDGVPDKDDRCPNDKGTAANKGCPDTDGDGVVDIDDACPNEAGPASNKGCPELDADKDGVIDKEDDCPTVAGPASNKGCPEVTPEVVQELKVQARSVFFESSKSDFKAGDASTMASLDAIREILKNYPNAKWSIEGHTDSTGSDKLNQKLSEDRANAVRDAMIERGMNPDNVTAVGFGASKPITTNKTKEGRAENRRTEVRHVGSSYEGKL